ncbi:MAG: hypothetical protein ACKV2U_02575 [Bryobacteraceae bacterium]
MHTRRFITFLLGAWFALVITIAVVASTGFQVAGRTSKSPPGEAARAVIAIGEPMAERLFRYVAAEINRTLFQATGLAELALLLALTCLLFLQNYSRVATILAGVLLLAACASYFLLTPQVVAHGRILDFRPAAELLTDRARFKNLHMMYGLLTVFRLLCAAWITGILLFRGPNSRMRRRFGNVDAIDNAEDGHVDR